METPDIVKDLFGFFDKKKEDENKEKEEKEVNIYEQILKSFNFKK